MKLEEVYFVIKTLEVTSSSIMKSEILRSNLHDDEFIKVLKLAMDDDKVFKLKSLPATEVIGKDDIEIFTLLYKMADSKGCTSADAQLLADTVGVSKERRYVVNKILQKDLGCGVGAKLVNNIHPGLIFRVGYQRFSSFSKIDKCEFEGNVVLVQTKYDGMFDYLFPDFEFVTRNGSKFRFNNLRGLLKDDLNWIETDMILMGELLTVKNGKVLDRKTGNGILNSIIHGGVLPNDVEIRYVTWGYVRLNDFFRGESDETYLDMFQHLKSIVPLNSNVVISKTARVYSLDEALDFFDGERARGEEGAMVKVANKLKWKDESSGSKYGYKLKPIVEGEFEIIEPYYGDDNGRFAGLLGGFLVKSRCGQVVAKVGSGLSDEMRNLGVDHYKDSVGKIVTIKFTEISKSKTKKTYSLSHPRFVEFRHDKTKADNLETLIEAVENNNLRR